MELNLLLLLFLAIAPAVAFGVFIYWRDKFEKEPIHLLALCFFLGAASCIPAAFIEVYSDELIMPLQYDYGLFLSAFALVGLVEEGCKYLVTYFSVYKRKAFDEPYDGITYAVMVSLGFATLENIVFVMKGGVNVGLYRMITAIPAHVTFGVIMGYFLGLAKFRRTGTEEGKQRNSNSIWFKLLALFMPVLFHGSYDFALYSAPKMPIMLGGAAVSLLLGIILSLRAIHLHRKNSPFNPNGKNFNGKKYD